MNSCRRLSRYREFGKIVLHSDVESLDLVGECFRGVVLEVGLGKVVSNSVFKEIRGMSRHLQLLGSGTSDASGDGDVDNFVSGDAVYRNDLKVLDGVEA